MLRSSAHRSLLTGAQYVQARKCWWSSAGLTLVRDDLCACDDPCQSVRLVLLRRARMRVREQLCLARLVALPELLALCTKAAAGQSKPSD